MKIRLEIEGKNAGSVNYRGPDSAEMAIAYLNSIDAEEIQVNLVSDDGTKAFAEFEGEISAISASRFILSAAKSKLTRESPQVGENGSELTLKERLEMFLKFEFSRIWFSSFDVQKKYEDVYGNISLSTVSTYLARMYRDNLLERRGNRNQREYHIRDGTNPLVNIENIEYAASK
ncbi:MAG: hypothetical protein FIB08_11155 [Candidatus Methanoperedens sp.]|nr:hypothetical protein [Candidatus Methanoperedens sp.]